MTWEPGDLLRLETDRFVVRSGAREDVTDDFLAWLADPEVMIGLNLPQRKLSRTQAVRYVLAHDNRTRFFLLVCDKADGRAIGFFIVTADPKHRCAETSVVIGDRDYWGKNVVIEVRSAILDFLFDTLDMHKVLGKPHGRNFSSIFNYKAMSFECEAVLREQMRAVDDGTARLDQLIFAIFKTEWQARKDAASG